MNTTIEALQGLYVAMGGTLTDVENIVTIPDMIDAITDQYTTNKAAETTDEITDDTNESTEENS